MSISVASRSMNTDGCKITKTTNAEKDPGSEYELYVFF
jgi:hypothetical protein